MPIVLIYGKHQKTTRNHTMASWTSDVLISPGKNYFAFNLRYLNIIGCLGRNDYNKVQRYAYTAYEICLNFATYSMMIITLIGTYTLFEDKMMFFTNLGRTVIGCSTLRLIPLLFNKKLLKELISEIMSSGDKITAKCERQMTILTIVLNTVAVTLITSFTLISFFDGQMPIYAWLPFDPFVNNLNLFLATMIIIVIVTPATLRTIGQQCFVCSLLMYFNEQLRELQWRLKNLEYTDTSATEFREEFRDIIIKHVRMIRYAKQLNVIYKLYFFVHNLGITTEVCIHAVVVTLTGFQDLKLLMTLLTLLVLTLANTYTQFYFGNEMIVQSQALSLAGWEANWTIWPVDLQKDLLFLITSSQKELKLSAGGFSDISLRTYAQICYNGYTVFTVLHDMV